MCSTQANTNLVRTSGTYSPSAFSLVIGLAYSYMVYPRSYIMATNAMGSHPARQRDIQVAVMEWIDNADAKREFGIRSEQASSYPRYHTRRFTHRRYPLRRLG